MGEEDLVKSGVSEELIRLSIGLESSNDILFTLDQAIAKATNEPATITFKEDDAVKWLVSSPFDRSNGGIRKKVITVAGAEKQETKEKVAKLQSLGFEVSSLSTNEGKIDAVWIPGKENTKTSIEELINKQVAILFVEQPSLHENLVENAAAAGITVIAETDPYNEAIRTRSGGSLNIPVEV